MELWRELLINGLLNQNYEFKCINDNILKEILEIESYKVLYKIKQIIEDESLIDEDCFMRIEEIISTLEENNVFCNRHDFG